MPHHLYETLVIVNIEVIEGHDARVYIDLIHE